MDGGVRRDKRGDGRDKGKRNRMKEGTRKGEQGDYLHKGYEETTLEKRGQRDENEMRKKKRSKFSTPRDEQEQTDEHINKQTQFLSVCEMLVKEREKERKRGVKKKKKALTHTLTSHPHGHLSADMFPSSCTSIQEHISVHLYLDSATMYLKKTRAFKYLHFPPIFDGSNCMG